VTGRWMTGLPQKGTCGISEMPSSPRPPGEEREKIRWNHAAARKPSFASHKLLEQRELSLLTSAATKIESFLF
jgi:hypothetical protein